MDRARTLSARQSRPARGSAEGEWFVYLLRCSDGSLYTGIARDVAARVEEHNRGLGAKYTRGRGPVEVLGTSPPLRARGDALRIEARIKRLRADGKLAALLAIPDPRESAGPEAEGASPSQSGPNGLTDRG